MDQAYQQQLIAQLMNPQQPAGVVMSDAMPDGVISGARYAQSSPYQIRPLGNGQVQVINVQTGQVHFTGTQSGASNAQASLNYRNR